MATSQNKYAVLLTNRTTGPLPRLRRFHVGTEGIYLRDGSAGFLLAHVAHWFDANIEKIVQPLLDDWGWAVRPVRGQTTGYSNHASGTAIDINATRHPRGRSLAATFSAHEVALIHEQLKRYDGCVRWGGDYHNPTPTDGMHFEINDDLGRVQAVARELWQSKHGKPVIDANPGLAEVIWDGNVPGDNPPTPTPKPKRGAMFDLSYAKDKLTSETLTAAAKAGMRGAGRYLSGNSRKDLSKAEITRHHKAGLWVLPVFERQAGEALGGKTAGASMREAAEAQAKALDIPTEDAIIYAVDQAVTSRGDRAAVLACFRALNAGNEYPVGAYGSADVLDLLGAAGLATAFWQTTAWSTIKGKVRVSKYAQILQVTTHSRSIAGLTRTDWDENLILTGRPKIPVWNPGEPSRSARKPPPPPPPPNPVTSHSTTLTLVGEPEVLEKRSSDHRAVVWTVQLSSGETVRMGQANLQGTDPIGTTRKYVDWLLPQADAWVFNEVTSYALQKYVRNLEGWGRYMHGFGADATKKADAAAVAILWNREVLAYVDAAFEVLSRGVFHIEPTRVLPRVLLELRSTRERFWRQGAHTEQHVDVGGRARIKGALTGQNRRAKHNIAAIAADVVQATSQKIALPPTVSPVRGGGVAVTGGGRQTYPLFGSGDLNVDYDADRREVLKDGGTHWFPYTVLGRVAKIRALNHHGSTHGGRLIDWGWMRQAH